MKGSAIGVVRRTAVSVIVATGLVSPRASAQAGSPSDATAELRAGFALRKEGRFEEALPHLANSYRLAPQVKALLNLADCEEHLGHLLDAEQHWISARDLAARQGDDASRDESVDRLQALQARIPRITVVLADGAPAPAEVTIDGAPVPARWLGVALPSEVGRHVVGARAPGYSAESVAVELAERDSARVELSFVAVTPAAESPVAPAIPEVVPIPPRAPAAPRAAARASDTKSQKGRADGVPLLSLGVGLIGLGLGGIVIGAAEGMATKQDHASALSACGGDCASSVSAQVLQANARNTATLANVGFVAGGLLTVAGGVLVYLATRRGPDPGRSLRAMTVAGPRSGGLVLAVDF